MNTEIGFSLPSPENTKVPDDIDERRGAFYRLPTLVEALKSEKIATGIGDLAGRERDALRANLRHRNGQAFLKSLSSLGNNLESLNAFTENDTLSNLPLTAGVTEVLAKHFLLLIDSDLSKNLDTWDVKSDPNHMLLDIMNGYFDEYYDYYQGTQTTESDSTQNRTQKFTIQEDERSPRTVSRTVIFDGDTKTARRIIFEQSYMTKTGTRNHTTAFHINEGLVSFEHTVQ